MAPRLDLPPAVRALAEATRAIVMRASSAQVAIARLDGIVTDGLVPAVLREDVRATIDDAIERTVAPIAMRDIEKALAGAWGDKPGKVLDELDPEPLAVLPHGQVHRGVLDGETVAITVLRPGLAAQTRSELALLDTLAGPARAAFPGIDPGALTREIRERIMDELDLEHEANVHKRAARALRRVPGVSAVAIHGELTTETVLTASFAEGTSLAERAPEDPAAVARVLVRVWAGAPAAIGAVLANPRANDVFVGDDREVTLLRLGAARDVSPERREAAIDAVEALRGGDEDAFADAVVRLGVLDAETARRAHAIARDLLGDMLTGPALLDEAVLAELGERALDRLPQLLSIAMRATPSAEDLWPARALGQAVAVLARLGVTEDWIALALEAGREGWQS